MSDLIVRQPSQLDIVPSGLGASATATGRCWGAVLRGLFEIWESSERGMTFSTNGQPAFGVC